MRLGEKRRSASEGARKQMFGILFLGLQGLASVLLTGCGGGSSEGKATASPPSVSGEVRNLFDQGKQYTFEKRYPQAIEAFTRAIERNPQFQQAYVWRGVARQESGQKQKALEDFTKAIELDPTDNYALEQRAKLYREMGQLSKAQADEDRAAQLREKNREQFRRNVEEAKKRKKRP